jgi:hypothetical protein
MNEFNQFQQSGPGRLRELEERRRSVKKTDQNMEQGSRETDRGREDEMMANESKYVRRDADRYSVECRT